VPLLNGSIFEDAALEWFGDHGGKRVKSEIGRVKSQSPFPISLFTLLHSPLLPKLLSGELNVADFTASMTAQI
jgi:hypothetical protein